MKKLKNIIIILLFNLLIFLFLGEISTYLLPSIFEKKPPYNTAEKDDYLGWKAKGNYTFNGPMYDINKQTYSVQLTSKSNGFRVFDTIKKDSLKRLLFVGDSFTQAVEVSDDKTFYHHIRQGYPAHYFVYGMAGYGHLQEMMLIDQVMDTIQPDLVILQVCTNDFIDNYLPLERNSNYRVGLRRPYLSDDGSIEYHSPLHFFDRMIQHSQFLSFLQSKWFRVLHKINYKSKNTSEAFIASQGLDYLPYKKAVDQTKTILIKLLNQIPSNKLIVFSADRTEPQFTHLKNICSDLSIPFYDPIAKVEEAKSKGQVVNAVDGYHWNEEGHEIVGKDLLNAIKHHVNNNK